MPFQRLSMRKLFDVLRLRHESKLSHRSIGRCLRISHTTVRLYLERFGTTGLSWPLPPEIDESELARRLFPPVPLTGERSLPDWSVVHTELRHKGVTLQLLWFEYKERHPDGFQYTWFTTTYSAWTKTCDLVMRQLHRAGERLFVDFAGPTIPVHDALTGEVFQAQIFVASLGASSYTYAEATRSQDLADWIGAHVRTFRFLGGCPEIVTPDNLRSAVNRAHRYEPDINRSYQEMAVHYAIAIVPARPRAPKDKGTVEANVALVERWILARLRHETFLSLADLNRRIAELVTWVNARPFRRLAASRRSLFEDLDRPALRPLPAADYSHADWAYVRVPPDYHVVVEHHHYSVPYQLVGLQIEVRLSTNVIECFFKGRRVASHVRSALVGGTTTLGVHRPKAHQAYADWDQARLTAFADGHGGAIAAVVGLLVKEGPHLQVALNRTRGVARLEDRFGAVRLQAACRLALQIGSHSFKSLESILKNNLDGAPDPAPAEPIIAEHANLRGATYFC